MHDGLHAIGAALPPAGLRAVGGEVEIDGAYFGGGSEEEKLAISKPVGEIQYEGAPVSVFPNPAMDILNIRLAGKGEEHVLISIVDATGRVLKQVRVDTENSDFPVSVSDLPSGAYHYRISTSQQITAGTFLKY